MTFVCICWLNSWKVNNIKFLYNIKKNISVVYSNTPQKTLLKNMYLSSQKFI